MNKSLKFLIIFLIFSLLIIGCNKKRFNPNIKGKWLILSDESKTEKYNEKIYKLRVVENGKVKNLIKSDKYIYSTFSPSGNKVAIVFEGEDMLKIFTDKLKLIKNIKISNANRSNLYIRGLLWKNNEEIIYGYLTQKLNKENIYINKINIDTLEDQMIFKQEGFDKDTWFGLEGISPNSSKLVIYIGEVLDVYLYLIDIQTGKIGKLKRKVDYIDFIDNENILVKANHYQDGSPIDSGGILGVYNINIDDIVEIVEQKVSYFDKKIRLSPDKKYYYYSSEDERDKDGERIFLHRYGIERKLESSIPVSYMVKCGKKTEKQFLVASYTKDIDFEWWQGLKDKNYEYNK